jgi:pyruvate/2-oxoglutarate dehydrogenase complex dihydrolipoamide acyltransferase (E2) component
MASKMEKKLFELKTPDLGDAETIELVVWYKKVGDVIQEGEEVLELVTDKAAFPMESPYSGKLLEITQEKGSKVSKGQVLGVLERDGLD